MNKADSIIIETQQKLYDSYKEASGLNKNDIAIKMGLLASTKPRTVVHRVLHTMNFPSSKDIE